MNTPCSFPPPLPFAQASHFQEHSRGCGILMMGCQSLCMLEELPCNPGRLTLATASDSTCLRETGQLHVVVMRGNGSDGSVQASLRALDMGGNILSPSTRVEWGDGDEAPRAVVFWLEYLRAATMPYLTVELEAAPELAGPVTRQTIALACPHGQLLVGAQNISVLVRQRVAHIAITRLVAGPPGAAGKASVRALVLGGQALPDIDYVIENHALHWAAGQAGQINLTIRLRDDMDCNVTNTLYLTLVQPLGFKLPQMQPVIALHLHSNTCNGTSPEDLGQIRVGESYWSFRGPATLVVDDSFLFYFINSPSAPCPFPQLAALSFLDEIPDSYARDRFLGAWKSVRIDKGDTLLNIGSVSRIIYAVRRKPVMKRLWGEGQTRNLWGFHKSIYYIHGVEATGSFRPAGSGAQLQQPRSTAGRLQACRASGGRQLFPRSVPFTGHRHGIQRQHAVGARNFHLSKACTRPYV